MVEFDTWFCQKSEKGCKSTRPWARVKETPLFLCLDLFIVSRYKKLHCDNLCRYRKCVTVAVEKQHCSSPDETDTGEQNFNRTSAAERRSMYGRQCYN